MVCPQLQEWERTVTEPLYEYGQFSNIIKSLLKYRHQKHLQWEMIGEVLEGKRMQVSRGFRYGPGFALNLTF